MYSRLEDFCRINGILWSVWVDDITISGSKELLSKHKNKIDKIIKSIPFKISAEKETGIIIVGSNRGLERKRLMTTTGITLNGSGRLSLGRRKKILKKQALRAKVFSDKLFGKLQDLKTVDPRYGKSIYHEYKKRFR
jgi:hypothetical protein